VDVFVRIRVKEGMEAEAEKAFREVVRATRDEPDCVGIEAFRDLRDSRMFYIHSAWKDEDAFEHHATLPHTVAFIARMKELMDQVFEVTRTEPIAAASDTSYHTKLIKQGLRAAKEGKLVSHEEVKKMIGKMGKRK
jgi:quinol monooxygenase YgiN